uniref:NAD-dependent epimerase/dehydratase domain-containing protein n=1 Tax=Leersia perrieri TaxID=77586 RepID=A0A0D9VN64_9ORYZ
MRLTRQAGIHPVLTAGQPHTIGSLGCLCKRPAMPMAIGGGARHVNPLILPHPAKLKPPTPSTCTRRREALCCSLSTDDGPSTMIVSITGATGFVGRRLVQKLLSEDHKVCILTRSASKAKSVFPASTCPGITIAEQGDWDKCIQSSTAVVNLAGMPISTRWSTEIKREIKESRINVTSKVVNYINNANADARPSVFVSATAIGFYGTSEISSFDESSPSGNDYLAEDGGALAKMIPLFMMFAGGPLGTGQQWFSWIHLDDLVDLVYESLKNPAYKGVINGTAPNPVRLSEMCEQLGRVVGRPSWLPVLEGQKVLPVKAKQLGFSYRYPYVQDALRAIASDL